MAKKLLSHERDLTTREIARDVMLELIRKTGVDEVLNTPERRKKVAEASVEMARDITEVVQSETKVTYA